MRTITAIAVALAAWPALAGDGLAPKVEPPAENKKITFDQKLGEKVPLDLEFADETGEPFTLGQGVNGKPTILILSYYRCPMLCGEVLAGTLDAMRLIPDLTCGTDYNVVAVSFDPKEKPAMALPKKRRFVTEYGRKEADWGWHFLTGKQENIDKLTAAVGFHYEWDPMLKEYNHPSGIMVLTPDGAIARYFAGIEYLDRNFDGQLTKEPARTLKMTLVEAGKGGIGTFTDKVFLSCYQYNPHTGKYSANVMGLMRLAGLTTLLVIAGVYFKTSWKLPGGRVFVVGLLMYICLIPLIMYTQFSVDDVPKWVWRALVFPVLLVLGLIGRLIWRSATRPAGAADYADDVREPADRGVTGVQG